MTEGKLDGNYSKDVFICHNFSYPIFNPSEPMERLKVDELHRLFKQDHKPNGRRIHEGCSSHRSEGGPIKLADGKEIGDRLLSKINKTDSCWLWTGTIDLKGYGSLLNDLEASYHRVCDILESAQESIKDADQANKRLKATGSRRLREGGQVSKCEPYQNNPPFYDGCDSHHEQLKYCDIGLQEACREAIHKAFMVSPENMANIVLKHLSIEQSTGYLILKRVEELRDETRP